MIQLINLCTNNYKTLKVWQLSRELTKDVYVITKKFPSDEKWSLINQLRRCSVSVLSNIADYNLKGLGLCR
ncbi:MAG: four helix bundle protein [bacterium]|jgi:hypothetical protein